ncbi:MAG: undecaprenyl/decaprenyl-phosphate alpha-N-acetylglucosaminyl 1-phosphate transferase, partial [Firmicutes bacterium]|nr:undecaprenyl/decaprenyl-phosphate alpha-N-acetylglucosaminyl 1-phosphate transferase [Bacillota bacterium]
MNQVSAIDLWTIFLTAFFVTLATTPLSIVLARKTGAMDVPKDARRVHDHPVPRIGGIGIFFGIMLGYFVA